MGKVLFIGLLMLMVSMTACNQDTGVIKGVTKMTDLTLKERNYAKEELGPLDESRFYDIQLFNGKKIHATGDINGHKIGDTVEVIFDTTENYIIEQDEEGDLND